MESNTTPNGTLVEFETEPKRLYRVNGTEVPSVTTVLDVLHKPALVWWGMQRGIEGVCNLFNNGSAEYIEDLWEAIDRNDVQWLTDQLTQKKLTVNHVRDAAGARGTSVHGAMEAWAATTEIPDASFWPVEEQGYVRGLAAFLMDVRGDHNGLLSEIMVGSAEFGYAGRYDLSCVIDDSDVVVKTYPKRSAVRETLPAGRWMFDLKTSSGVYPSHYMQLAAYEAASVECGYEPTMNQAVVRVGADGDYEVRVSDAKLHHFLGVRSAWQTMEDLK